MAMQRVRETVMDLQIVYCPISDIDLQQMKLDLCKIIHCGWKKFHQFGFAPKVNLTRIDIKSSKNGYTIDIYWDVMGVDVAGNDTRGIEIVVD